MPAISRIRFTNVIYENGDKRYNDDIFQFDGHNGAIILENGGGKTVFVQTAIQAILPHAELADRKIKNTLMLENSAAHIAIEWILNEHPRRYALTSVTLFMNKGSVDSYKYVYEYQEDDDATIENLPFVKEGINGNKRPATKEEMGEYYSLMSQNRINAHHFNTIRDYNEYIESNFKIIPSEWRKIALINGAEGDVEAFFDSCKTTGQLVDNLLIPTVEEALSGNGTKEFAETFEKQREHFKKYNQLKARIEESRRVEAQINGYVKVYEDYDEVNSKVINVKGEIKSLHKFASDELQINEEKLQNNFKAQSLVETEERQNNQEEASYNLELLNQKMIKADKKYQEASDNYKEIQSTYEEKEQRKENLRIAKYKQNIKVQHEKIELLKEQISLLDKDEDVADLNEKLSQNSSEIKGYFLDKEEKINKDKFVVEGQLTNIKKEIKLNEDELASIRDKVKELSKSKGGYDSAIDLLASDMDSIERKILSNPSNEKIEEELIKWNQRITYLEEVIFAWDKERKSYEDEKSSINKEFPILREGLKNLNRDENDIRRNLNDLNENHDKLLAKVKEFRSSWYSFDSLYLKQSTLLTQIENSLEKLRLEKEDLIFNERLAHRYLDDYSESEYYTADHSIERWIKSWRNQFKYIETGTQFVQRMAKNSDKTLEELIAVYSYWTITVITSDQEKDKITAKIKNQSDSLTHPVIIMTEKEARNKIDGKNSIPEDEILFPKAWQTNVVQSYFDNWKSEISIKANEATTNRKAKEIQFSRCDELLKDLRGFYNNYSYEEYTGMQKNLEDIKNRINLLTDDIHKKEERIKFIDIEFKRINKSISDSNEEKGILESKVINANEYLNKKATKLSNETQRSKIEQEIELATEESNKWEKRIKQLKKSEEDIVDEINRITYDIKLLQSESLYEEVKNASPKYSSLSKETLESQRKNLKDALDKKQEGRAILDVKMKSAKDSKYSSEKELKSLRNQANFTIDEELNFPLSGDDEIEKLIYDLKELRKRVINLKDIHDTAKSSYDKSSATYESKKKDFYNAYSEIIKFRVPLDQVPEVLKEKKDSINKKKEYILKQKISLQTEITEIKDNIILIESYNTKHSFLAEEINEVELSEELILKFPYKRTEVTKEIIEEIEKLTKITDEKKIETERQKQSFISFCNTEILDVKLRGMATSGVEYKTSFQDIVDWQNKMRERINRTIEIAENDMREHDKEVQQFINHLHSYLDAMVRELKQIPKKTRIKIDEDWKEVFIINVPEWDEKEGKEEIAKHMDWMLKELESTEYRDENGVEVDSKVRNSISKWLESKQLLRIVMKQNNIKVKCRKVTNDEKMSSSPFSWEVSNSWSGGEKWSKNMTLFLGILNYLAEKRTQIIPSHKRYRTVIVDNPFGKASSDHVLNPVFFIAQQLGFQIIALTAHAEGKFIRTYFPIVYSCRLREAGNASSQIMTKEREIRKAYFKDGDPQTLKRLGQLQQIGLFDSL